MSIAVKSGLPSLGSTEGAVISADEVSVSEDGSAAASVGEDLPRGKSAYEIAKENGFNGTETEWLASLKGEPGAAGASGKDGENGKTPYVGDNGNWFVGSDDTGKPSRGAKGEKGDKGDTGAQGIQGEQGIQGVQGEKGEKGDTGAQGPQGLQGLPGEAGADGKTPNLTIGTVTTLEAGQNATASMGGTAESPVLNLGIPRGAKGEPGQDGVTPTFSIESVETGEPGTDAEVTMTGDAPNHGLKFVIPRGDKGDTGVADGSINPDKTTWMRQVWHNILDVSASTDGQGFYSEGAGTIAQPANSVSAKIPVKAGAVYRVVNITNIRWLNSTNAVVGIQANNTMKDRFETAPDGAAYAMMQYVTANAEAVQVHEYIGEVCEYDTYKNLYSIVVTDAGYSKAIADMIDGKVVDGSLAPADLFADESILYKQMKGWGEFHWNLVDADKLEEGTINGTTGADAPAPNAFIHRRTPYMPVTPGETLRWLWGGVYGYDANKNFVSEMTQTGGIGVVPDGVYFIRATRYGNNVEPTINVYRNGYGQNDLYYASEYPYSHGFPVFKDEDSKEGFECYLGIHPWADKKFSIIGDSFTAPGTWCNIMRENLKAASGWNHAVSGGAFADYDGVPKTAYEQAQEMVTNGNTPDVILITMGTNDANNSRTIGDIVQSNSISDFDLTTYTGGMQACLNYLQNNFPNAIIYVGWTPMGGLSAANAEYITRMQEVCLMYGVEYIETRTCGVTRFSDVYAECYESGTNGGHPTGVGQQKIGAYMTRLMQSKM